jgi:hypothetical protein
MQSFANWVETTQSKASASDGVRQARASAASG